MTSVRADWHLGDLDIPRDEGGFDIVSIADGVIDLVDPDELHSRLRSLLDIEAAAWNHGIRCAKKQDAPDSKLACRSCAEGDVRAADNDLARGLLCRVGREQQGLIERLDRINRQMTAEHDSLAVAAGVIEALETADAQVLDLVEVAEHLCAA